MVVFSKLLILYISALFYKAHRPTDGKTSRLHRRHYCFQISPPSHRRVEPPDTLVSDCLTRACRTPCTERFEGVVNTAYERLVRHDRIQLVGVAKLAERFKHVRAARILGAHHERNAPLCHIAWHARNQLARFVHREIARKKFCGTERTSMIY